MGESGVSSPPWMCHHQHMTRCLIPTPTPSLHSLLSRVAELVPLSAVIWFWGCVPPSTPSGFPNPYNHLYSAWWHKVFSQMPLTHMAGGWNPNAGQMGVREEWGGWGSGAGKRAGSMPCLSQHQLRWAVLMHFICQHGGRIISCNQKHGRGSLSWQLSLNSNSASSSGVGGSTKQQPWLLMILGPTRDLRFIGKAPVRKVIYLWPPLLLLLE